MRHSIRAGLMVAVVAWAVPWAQAADLPPTPIVSTPLPAPPGWSFRSVSYGWLTSLTGTQTVRGRSTKVDASFLDIVEKSDSLIAVMSNIEARNGPFAVYGDVVFSRIGVGVDGLRTRSALPGVTGTVGRSLNLTFKMLILEVGASYELARSGPFAFDILGGARYWNQEADLSLDTARTSDIRGLQRAGNRSIAASGSVDWIDPVVGARIRYAVAPGHELSLRGDVGGFGVGSEFSWQAIAAYGFEVGRYGGITFSGLVGYRALSVDYSRGEGRRRYEFDMVQHGPVLGVIARF
jgi:hypothetical protein